MLWAASTTPESTSRMLVSTRRDTNGKDAMTSGTMDASLAIECGALVSIVAADTRVVNGQTLGSMLLALPEGEGATKALDYIKNYPGITYEEVGSNG